MATSFVDIYDLSISQFDSPEITKAYVTNPISFFQIMYNYMNNAIPAFNNPLTMPRLLNDKVAPDGDYEEFTGVGTVQTYALSSTPLAGSYFNFIVNGQVDSGATFDYSTNSVTYSNAIPNGVEASWEWYYVGQFNQTLDYPTQSILAKLLTAHWAMKEKNFQLDIRRLLNDNDFKMGSEANSIRAKVNWYDEMREEAEKLMNQYAWNMKFAAQQGL